MRGLLKTFNYIKYQIAFKLSNECKALLPSEFKILSIDSLQEHFRQCFKAALYHIHTCTIKNCTTLPKDTEHNIKNLSSLFFTDSYDHFPAPTNTQSKPKWTYLVLDFSIFNKNQPNSATFNKPTPITFLHQLASKTKNNFTELNNTDTNQA